MKAVLATLLVLVGCSGPVPTEQLTASPPMPSTDPDSAARAAGLLPEQLVRIEEGFVAAQFDDDGVLRLVWIRPADDTFETVVLGTTGEARAAEGVARISVYPVICPADAGLTRTRFIVGEATGLRHLTMNGVPSVGGQVVDDMYAFAFDPTDAAPSQWTISDENGQDVVTSDPTWFTESSPPPPQGDGLCSLIEH